MNDKVILLTGATAGIGQQAARELIKTGCTLVCVARNESKAKTLVDELNATSGSTRASYLIGDLSRPAEVRRVAQEFRERHTRLDVLFNNAGAMFMDRQVTEDGLEKTFALNHLGYFVLTTELLDLLESSAPARVVSTASAAHAQGDLAYMDDWQSERYGLQGMKAYGRSKLANIWFTREFAKRVDASKVTATCFHPGFVASEFARNNGMLGKVVMTLTRPFQRNVQKGADTGVWLATAPDVAGKSGGYYFNRKERRPTKTGRDETGPGKLWAESERLVEKILA
ncbi:SDR family NAD(P)-dependent oxidoreductase [Planctomycetota bacterium]|nr:SDR family NAD(P)-dependent oxidoreductase [Planctomycetota bacterium]